jgi:small ligand-binding sensory domain FIST
MPSQIQWTNALSTRASLEAAVTEVVEKVKQSLFAPPDLGIVFISSAYSSDYPRLMPLLLDQFSLPVVIGCGGGGIVGINDEGKAIEVEENTALSLSVASLPEVEIEPFHVNADDLPDLDSSPEAWTKLIAVPPEKQPDFILLSDPFSSKINELLEGLDFAYPGSSKVGGLSSGSNGLNTALFYYSEKHPGLMLYREGTVGIALSGNIVLETIVAQGCRPIGRPYRVNQCDRNIIIELVDHRNEVGSPLDLLREMLQTLSEEDRELAQSSLFIGMARDEFKMELKQGDFLIRNLLGVDPKYGAIAVGDRVRPGQRIQFHLRDAQTSAEDLEMLLINYQREKGNSTSAYGALMFSCLGRGRGLYNKPDFDSSLFHRYLKNVPLGGFFCNGEIGPVGGSTFLHGYTSVFGIFCRPSTK